MTWYHLILDRTTWLEAQFYFIAFARRVVAVEMNKALCAAAEVNLKVNNIKNVLVIPCDSEVFARNILQKKCYTRKDTGEAYDFKSVLVDPPRSENCTGASRHSYVHWRVRQYHICFPLCCLFLHCYSYYWYYVICFFNRYQSSMTYPLFVAQSRTSWCLHSHYLSISIRAGLDRTTLRLVALYESIIYISCSPDSLARDLTQVGQWERIGGRESQF